MHAKGHDPADVVSQARLAEIDLIAITDHQSFEYFEAVAGAATSPGRKLVVLPGIEVTANEGVHLLAIFPASYSADCRMRFYGWLEVQGSGSTREASRRGVLDILRKVEIGEGGIIVVPHPFADGIGLLDSARKISTKEEWLESGHVRLFQVSNITSDRIGYIGHDEDGNWVNRYVLASASPQQVKASRYCLAPFNRSDSHSPHEIGHGCSWFHMQELGVEGLKQVTCEPRTRISLNPPATLARICIAGLAVHDGYCRDQVFYFNECMNCLVGPNYAGKSTVLDLVRFGLGHDKQVRQESREHLLTRLGGTLGVNGRVEVYLRRDGIIYVIQRMFTPQYVGGPEHKVAACPTDLLAYRYDTQQDQLVPLDALEVPIEVYEQGRIHDLRNDLHRQLEMLDEFAGLQGPKEERRQVVAELLNSAATLAPLLDEREQLQSALAELSTLQSELNDKEQLLPAEERDQWAISERFVAEIEAVVEALSTGASLIEEAPGVSIGDTESTRKIFSQRLPDLNDENVVHLPTLSAWREVVAQTLKDVEAARGTILASVGVLTRAIQQHRDAWTAVKEEHDRTVSQRLRETGIASPKELIDRVSELRQEVSSLEDVKQPRLVEVEELIRQCESARNDLLAKLEGLDISISKQRETKAVELTAALGEHVQVFIQPRADRKAYFGALKDLVGRLGEGRIRNRDAQLQMIVDKILPIDLTKSLALGGRLPKSHGLVSRLEQLCGITENTQSVMCGLARDIRLLTALAIVEVPDIPQIRVRRRGEANFADLRSGLSPGEQSAAILTLALHTRNAPLIIDQPEDELGYSYVVHLVVPKILHAKFTRQLLVVTHNANIPVLGDADLVTKMENQPVSENDRRCVIAVHGSFEIPAVTAALLELEGGSQAFQYRQHRYSIPRGAGLGHADEVSNSEIRRA